MGVLKGMSGPSQFTTALLNSTPINSLCWNANANHGSFKWKQAHRWCSKCVSALDVWTYFENFLLAITSKPRQSAKEPESGWSWN